MKLSAVILAAGQGKRMKSDLSKVMHYVAGKPLVGHVTDSVRAAGIQDIVIVVGHDRESVIEYLLPEGIKFAVQEEQLGTGHALRQAEEMVASSDAVLVLTADTPLIQPETLKSLIDCYLSGETDAVILSACLDDPAGYGRIVRSCQGDFERIVEDRDASSEEKAVNEINSGMYCFRTSAVFSCLSLLKPQNNQGELYLTDVLAMIKNGQGQVKIKLTAETEDIYGVNDRVQLAVAEKILRRRKNKALMYAGVTIMDPDSTFIDNTVEIGRDTIVYPFTIIEGATIIGDKCRIGPQTHINDTIIGRNVTVEMSRLKEAQISDDCNIGPFAYLRPGTVLHTGVKIGDFVEIKKSVIGKNSKIPHLSYVGDAQIGKSVNIGAGTITCNYDGKNKHTTILEDCVFVGSNTNLIAPVTVGPGAMIGAGSTISRDVPAAALAIERAEQKIIESNKE